MPVNFATVHRGIILFRMILNGPYASFMEVLVLQATLKMDWPSSVEWNVGPDVTR